MHLIEDPTKFTEFINRMNDSADPFHAFRVENGVAELDYPRDEPCSCRGDLDEVDRFSYLVRCISPDSRKSGEFSPCIQKAVLVFSN